ncbi:hypothetical protein QTP88_028060 [Uroleucon formosanum]
MTGGNSKNNNDGDMSIKEMDASHTSSCGGDPNQILTSEACETKNFRNTSHCVKILEDLQSLRKNEVLCDIRFETDDGCTTFGHKNVLMAASPYFRAMFKSRKIGKTGNNTIYIRKLNSTVLQLLVDYIYTGEIIVTKKNVQVLLPAANLLELDFVNSACCEFLQNQMDTSNCLGIRTFANLHNCTELFSTSEEFIKKQFLEVVKNDEYLSLSSEDVVKLISCNDLAVPFEEKVFDCVIKWVKHDLDHRKDFLPDLMEHVRLPLIKPDVLLNISEEPLLKNNPKCKDYVFDALKFYIQQSFKHITIPKTIRCEPRKFGGSQKVILMFSQSFTLPKCSTEWYDPTTNLREKAPGIHDCRRLAGLGVIGNQFVFVVGGVNLSSSKSVMMLDVSSQSPSWVPMVDMLVSREQLGVGVLDNCIYAVGGCSGSNDLNSVEIFHMSTQKWRMVSSMSTTRRFMGVCVLNNFVYAIGGISNSKFLKSVEYYDPALDTWTPVAEMSVCRAGVGVGVLDDIIYVIGGSDGKDLKSVEVYRPNEGVWSSVADMHFSRSRPGVAVLDGLLYVMGGISIFDKTIVNNVEMYNPTTNNWTVMTSGNLHFYFYNLETNHINVKDKPIDYFIRLRDQLLKNNNFIADVTKTANEKAIVASYIVNYRIAQVGKAHTIAESLIKPCVTDIVSYMLDEKAVKKINTIPLSNDTVRRRNNDILTPIKSELISRLKCNNFSVQLDESTDVSGLAVLLLYLLGINNKYQTSLEEYLLLCQPLSTYTIGYDIFNMLNNFFEIEGLT